MSKPDPTEGLSTTSITMNTLKNQNLTLANRITTLKRENADLSQHKNEFERKNLALETNASLLKQYWIKHLNELKAVRQLQKPFSDKKVEQEFEECLSQAMSVLDTLTFQQSQEEFQEKVAHIFKAEGKVYKDIITGSQRAVESAIEHVTSEIEQGRVSTELGLGNLSSFQQKLQELSDSIEQIRDSSSKIDSNTFLKESAEMKKKIEKLEEDLRSVKEYNEVLNRRYKIALRGFVQIEEDTEKEKECKDRCICGGKIFDYLEVKTIKATKGIEDDEYGKLNEERKAGEELELADKDIALLNENLEKSVKEKSGSISQKPQKPKKMPNDATINDEEETKSLKLENERYKKLMICPACRLNEKSVVLNKCFHTFCGPCISARMEARNRKCPVCLMRIGMDDIHTIYWDI